MARPKEFSDNVKKIRPLLRGMSTEELSAVHSLVNEEWTSLQNRAAHSFRKNDQVEFEDRTGNTVRGTVSRVNKKTVTIDVPGTRGWRVAPSLLRSVN